jgi:ATP-dependent Clp protease protease subunit
VTHDKLWQLDDDDSDEGEAVEERGGEFMGLMKRLIESRTIVVSEVVTDKLYRRVASMVTVLENADPDKPIYVYVNSPGGSADSGFAIYDLLRFSSCPVVSIANGIVASSAVLIYLAADDGKHYSLPHSRFLLHQPSTFSRGQASDIEITAKQIVKLRERYNKIVERHSGKEAAVVEKDADRDFWLDAAEAADYGLVNKVVERRAEIS